ncbi:hypothetical protein MM239_14360 [Belliella sp. DSM 111904]|uniref:Uncharacterized protein n=1 Tax=Belliella filtrata TaxID=2923435 RepID=A0ABS9V2E2_9BACT|nr:hypothetical protein [Belliella filtrata]MCH7410587.1 hypothetical protein [Belliella filtrata]
MENHKKEGTLTKKLEKSTANLPSSIYLWSAVSLMSTSLALKLLNKKHAALFVGQWVSPFLLFGIYNKIVKTEGSERKD